MHLQRLSPLLIIGTIVQVTELGNLIVMQTMSFSMNALAKS